MSVNLPFKVGDVVTTTQIHDAFLCSTQSGMNYSSKTNIYEKILFLMDGRSDAHTN